jgi:hypothetical protein
MVLEGDKLRLKVEALLEYPLRKEWTIQGLGMLRTFLDDDEVQRLHIWNPDTVSPEVSTVHDHPWDFTSEILSGFQKNIRFNEYNSEFFEEGSRPWRASELLCGIGGRLVNEPYWAYLKQGDLEVYPPGTGYAMTAEEIHESQPTPGAVTVITRHFRSDRDTARVFWTADAEWGSAEPRVATNREVLNFVALARENWGKHE